MAFTANCALLLRFAPDMNAGRVVGWAVAAIAGAIVLLLAVMLALWAMGAHPTLQVKNFVFSTIFTPVTLAMANIGHAAFRLAGDFVAAFHLKHNAANLNRFPLSVLIGRRRTINRVAAVAWCVGSGVMLYGVWFDMGG